MREFMREHSRASAAVACLFVAGVASGVALANSSVFVLVSHKFERLKSHFVAENLPATRVYPYESIETGLATLEVAKFPVGYFRGGGAIAPIGNDVLFVTTKGQIGYVHGDAGEKYNITYLKTTVPMGYEELKTSRFASDPNNHYEFYWFRTLGVLITETDGVKNLLVAHHKFNGTCVEHVISKSKLTVHESSVELDDNWETVFQANSCIDIKLHDAEFPEGQSSGGRLAELPDKSLLLTLGDLEYDGHYKPKSVSMDPTSNFGKVLQVDPKTHNVSTFAMGLRNPQGLFIGRDGTIWETEHGPRGGDEVNAIEKGQNYGWPKVSYGVAYDYPDKPWPPEGLAGGHEGYKKPVYAFVPSIGSNNIIETNSSEFPLWRGDLIVASLHDRAIWRLRRDGDHVAYSERIELGDGVRDIKELANGRLAVLTDSGGIEFIRTKPPKTDALVSRSVTVAGYEQVETLFKDIAVR